MTAPMTIGMVGLGRMGASMTKRLIDRGQRVVAYDSEADTVAEIAAHGAEGTASLPPDTQGLVAFPDAESILAVSPGDLRGLGFSMRKARYILSSAHAVATGDVSASRLEACDRAAATELLLAQRGIGRWSAEYILLRGVGRLDVFPADDVGARNNLQRLMELTHAPDRDEIISMIAPWSPWAGLVYFHLLLDGLARNGHIDG